MYLIIAKGNILYIYISYIFLWCKIKLCYFHSNLIPCLTVDKQHTYLVFWLWTWVKHLTCVRDQDNDTLFYCDFPRCVCMSWDLRFRVFERVLCKSASLNLQRIKGQTEYYIFGFVSNLVECMACVEGLKNEFLTRGSGIRACGISTDSC